MASAMKKTGVISAIAGAAFAATSMLAPTAATADEFIKVSEPQSTSTEYQWKSQELKELHEASLAAGQYAEDNYGVGILIHVGQDIPNKHFASADQFGETMVRLFKEKYGTDAKYFLRQNDARATGMEFYIDEHIHGANNGTEIKDVKEAIAAIPNVVGMLKTLKEEKVAQLDTATPVFEN